MSKIITQAATPVITIQKKDEYSGKELTIGIHDETSPMLIQSINRFG
jgi:hypothetical protein